MTVIEQPLVADPAAPESAEDVERERRARVLEAAALEIEMRGWCYGQRVSDSGSVCLVGAISAAKYNDPWFERAYEEAHYLWGGIGRDCMWLPDWNDQDNRTAAEVTFLLRWRAAEIRDGL